MKRLINILKFFFPMTYQYMYAVPELEYRQFLEIRRAWLGRTIRTDTYEIVDTPGKKEILDSLLQDG